MSSLAPESTTSSLSNADLATSAGVEEEAVAAFRSGVPSWRLERPGVIDAIALATGNDANLIRANLGAAKAKSYGLRAHGTSGPATFPGQTYPSLR